MHYYQFNISDYALHTRHLTLEEDCVYRRLIDYYYDTETPIPIETQPVIRRLILGSYAHEVELILQEFFTLEDDGWHNYRCDIEIKEYHAKADNARRNGKKGGRPPKNKGLETQPVILANPDETISKANQELRTTNQELRTKDTSGKTKFSLKRAIIDLGVSSEVANHWMTIRKNKKSANTELALKQIITQAGKASITPLEAINFAADNGWASFKAEWFANTNQQTLNQPVSKML